MNKALPALLAFVVATTYGTGRAAAEIDLKLGGYARSYLLYADNDEISTAAPGDSLRTFSFTRYTGLFIAGESKLDNGMSVGVKSEFKLGNEGGDGAAASFTSGGKDFNMFDEGYVYISGGWGKLMLGARDGAAYLLQVAAPAADSNVDGMRIYLQGWRADVWDDGRMNNSYVPAGGNARLGYDNADFGKIERLVYVTSKWNGVQAAIGYAPKNASEAVNGAFLGMAPDDRPGKFENIADAGLRWDTTFGEFKLAAGAGISHASTEADAAAGANGSADINTYDAGINISWHEFSVGAALRQSDTGVSGPDTDLRVVTAGIAWDPKPWHLAATVYDAHYDSNAFSIGLADDLEVIRTTLGGAYSLAPGISFRGTLSLLDADNGANSVADPRQVQTALGTDIAF